MTQAAGKAYHRYISLQIEDKREQEDTAVYLSLPNLWLTVSQAEELAATLNALLAECKEQPALLHITGAGRRRSHDTPQ